MAGRTIDALVVTLGLDSKQFADGIKGSTDQLASFTKRLAGMFIAVRSLEDVVGYFKDLHAELAQIGFTSRNLGVAGTEIKKLGEVSELFGGQMQDAADSVQGLQASVFNLRYKGQLSESLMMLQRFGVAYLTASGHARNFRDIALDAAKAIERQAKTTGMDKGERYQMALSFGFTGGVASAVAQGGKGLEDALNKAKVDQRALTERTIQGQVKLEQSLIRMHEATAAQSSAILSKLTPAIEQAIVWLQKLANDLLPKIVKAMDKVIEFFKNPPPWLKSIEQSIDRMASFLGPTGSLIVGLTGLVFAMGVGGALVKILGTLIATLALAPVRTAAGAVTALAPIIGRLGAIGLAAVAGYEGGKFLTDTLPKMLGADQGAGDWIGGKIYELTHPAPPTPTAPRPPSAAAQSAGAGQAPTAMAGGGTNVQIDSITVNTRATDVDGIAADMSGAVRRKLLVANADTGLS